METKIQNSEIYGKYGVLSIRNISPKKALNAFSMFVVKTLLVSIIWKIALEKTDSK